MELGQVPERWKDTWDKVKASQRTEARQEGSRVGWGLWGGGGLKVVVVGGWLCPRVPRAKRVFAPEAKEGSDARPPPPAGCARGVQDHPPPHAVPSAPHRPPAPC